MNREVSIVVVSHRTAAEAALCIESLRRDLQSGGIAGEVVLVDCGSGPAEVERLRSAGADTFLPLPDNRGYSGGCNAGSGARDRFPDRSFQRGRSLRSRDASRSFSAPWKTSQVGAVAPLAFWDAAGRIRMPPGYGPALPARPGPARRGPLAERRPETVRGLRPGDAASLEQREAMRLI